MENGVQGLDVLAEGGGSAPMDMHVSSGQMLALAGFVIGMLLFDRLVLNRKSHELGVREALVQLAFFVVSTIGFFAIVILPRYGLHGFIEVIGIYFSEYSLSIDNLFILMIILKTCRVPRELHQKALYWGINIAVVLRAAMVLGGSTVLAKAEFVMIFIAIYMIWVGLKQVFGNDETDITRKWSYRIITRILPVTYRTYGDNMYIVQGGKIMMTLLLLAILMIGNVDAVFALDSIPTALALTKVMFIAMAGNITGVLGLRPVYFLMGGITKRITRLNWGLMLICGGVGVKLILGNHWLFHKLHWGEPIEVPIALSLSWIAGSLLFAYFLGKLWPDTEVDLDEVTTKKGTYVRVYVDCGSAMDEEWGSGRMRDYLAQVVRQAAHYDTSGNIPVFAFAGESNYLEEVAAKETPSVRERRTLGYGSDFAGVLAEAKEVAESVAGTHVVVLVSSGVTINEAAGRDALRDMPENAFVVFVRVSEQVGGAEYLQSLDDMLAGELDRCNTVHATDDEGKPKDRIEYAIGDELDAYLKKRDALALAA